MKYTKIQEIIYLFENNEDFVLWNIKTRINGIIENFISKINRVKLETDQLYLKEDNSRYSLQYDIYNLTPINDFSDNINVSKSTITQYMDVLESFGVVQEKLKLNAYVVVEKELLKDGFNITSENILRNLLNMNSNSKKQKKLLFSTLISYLVWMCDDKDFNLYIPIKQKREYRYSQFSKKEIEGIYKVCGYDSMFPIYNEIININDVHSFVKKYI